MSGLFVTQLKTLITFDMPDGITHRVVTDYFNEEYLGDIERVIESHLPKIPSAGYIQVNPTMDGFFELHVHKGYPILKGTSNILCVVTAQVKPILEGAGRYFELAEIKGVKH